MEHQEYYDDYFELFSSKGWKQLDEEIGNHISRTIDSSFANDNKDQFVFHQGYVAALKYILAYPDFVKQVFEDNKGSDDADL